MGWLVLSVDSSKTTDLELAVFSSSSLDQSTCEGLHRNMYDVSAERARQLGHQVSKESVLYSIVLEIRK